MTNPTLAQAWAAFQQGQTNEAKSILLGLLRTNPQSVPAWLLLSEVVDNPHQQRDCLQRVLSLDPTNQRANDLLAALNAPPAPTFAPQPVEIPAAPAPTFAPQPVEIPAAPTSISPVAQQPAKDFKLPWEEYSEIQPQPATPPWAPQPESPPIAAWPPQQPTYQQPAPTMPLGQPAPFPQQGYQQPFPPQMQANWGNPAPFPFPAAAPKQSSGYGRIIMAFVITVVVSGGLLLILNLLGKPTTKTNSGPRPAIAADRRVKDFFNSAIEILRDPRMDTDAGQAAIVQELAKAYVVPEEREKFEDTFFDSFNAGGGETLTADVYREIRQNVRKIEVKGTFTVVEDDGETAYVKVDNLMMVMTFIDGSKEQQSFPEEVGTVRLSNLNGHWYMHEY